MPWAQPQLRGCCIFNIQVFAVTYPRLAPALLSGISRVGTLHLCWPLHVSNPLSTRNCCWAFLFDRDIMYSPSLATGGYVLYVQSECCIFVAILKLRIQNQRRLLPKLFAASGFSHLSGAVVDELIVVITQLFL